MSDERAHAVFTAADDGFHFDVMTDRWWETETSWFAFHNEERRLGGWLYTMVRPNIGTVAGGVWVWDDSARQPWEVLYCANYSAMPLDRSQDLTDATLSNGVSIKVIEPTMSYALGYNDGDRLTVDLRFDGVMAPHPLAAVGSTFGSAHHFDQFGRVTGHIVVLGERIPIDSISMRDRTWGPRPEHRPRQAAYVTGAVDAEEGFLAVTNTTPDGDPISYGFLRRDGRIANLAEGERRVERDPATGWVTEIRIDAVDLEGRELHAVGVPVSGMVINRHLFIDNNSLLRWDIDGREGWGEDQDMWPVHSWADFRRNQTAGR